MAVFACARCGAVLTAPLSRIALPVNAHHSYRHDLLPALMEPGTYAVDSEPWGPPWRQWSEIPPGEAAARGFFAPVISLSYGPAGAVVVAPGDTRGMALIPERCDGYCFGLDGRDGPNLACTGCGEPVATRIDDCSLWQAVWFDPRAVRRLSVDGPADVPAGPADGWDAVLERPGTPPVEMSGAWSPLWEAAVAAALAHLLAASAGSPVALPDGLLTTVFERAVGMLLPQGQLGVPERRVVLAGPGLPAPLPRVGDIALVPLHPDTGEAWQPSDTPAVPLTADVWLQLAFRHAHLPIPATGGLPDGVLRDDPPPPHPRESLRPDWDVLLATLARLPGVREPWLRHIYDRVSAHPYGDPF